jgi:hypothetical protein
MAGTADDEPDEQVDIEDEKISGKVAQILNARELVINRGSNDGVEIGMQFAILNLNGGEIKDPDTGEVLGEIEVPKVLVKITRVAARISVASTFRSYRTAGGMLHAGIFANMYAEPVTRFETLRTDETTYKEELSEEDSYVRIGDPVIEYKDGDFAGWGRAG